MTFAVEKGVPLPTTRGPLAKPIPYPFASMEMGDSFVIASKNVGDLRKLRNRLLKIAERYRNDHQAGFGVTTRECDGGLRVWRVPFVPKPQASRKLQIVPPRPPSYTHLLADDIDKFPKVQRKARA